MLHAAGGRETLIVNRESEMASFRLSRGKREGVRNERREICILVSREASDVRGNTNS
jgi:hypothetical protein